MLYSFCYVSHNLFAHNHHWSMIKITVFVSIMHGINHLREGFLPKIASREKMSFAPEFAGFGTDAIHAGQEPEKLESRSVVPMIRLPTTFKQESPGELRHGKWEYSRGGNPTRECLEECVAKLENGNYCMAYASGLAATMSMVEALLQVHIIAHIIYF